MKTYRLASAPMINTPGLVVWAINGYKFAKDRENILAVFTEGYQAENAPTRDDWDALFSGRVPYTVDCNNAVIFSVYEAINTDIQEKEN